MYVCDDISVCRRRVCMCVMIFLWCRRRVCMCVMIFRCVGVECVCV